MSPSLVTLFTAHEWSGILGLLVKLTALLLAGSVIVRLPRAAATRHLVWTLTLAGALMLPSLTPLAPTLGIQIGRTALSSITETQKRQSVPAIPGVPAKSSVASPPSILEKPPHASPSPPTRFPLVAVWLAGCVAFLLWSLVGHVGLARLARTASPLDGADWRALLEGALTRCGVTRRVRIERSPAVSAPVTWGWSHPIILLPVDADSWPIDRRRVAVVHEVAHVARNDYLAQLLASTALAVFWFHPLVWHAARRLRVESEHACDDRVLADGMPAADYAMHLLEVARRARGLTFGGMVVLSMARPSQLERRLVAVLDETRVRRAIPPRRRLAFVVALAVVLVPYAGLRAELGAAPPASRVPRTNTVAASPVQIIVASKVKTHEAKRERKSARMTEEDAQGTKVLNEIGAKPGEQLYLDLETGGTVDVRGWDEDKVQVRVHLGGADWRDTQVEMERMSGGVVVRSTQERGQGGSYTTSHAFEVQVPRRFDVRIRSGGGDVTLVDIEGTFRGNTGGGQIVLERTRGHAKLTTGGGFIDVSDSHLEGTISTGGGTVNLSRVRGGLKAYSGSGPVIYAASPDPRVEDPAAGDLEGITTDGERIHVDEKRPRARGMLSVEKAGGAIDLDEAPRGASVETGGGGIRIGRAGGDVEAQTGGGDIEIGPVAGSVRAGTGAGDVRVIVVDAATEEQTVDLSSGLGKIVVELPRGFDGRFELETAYTRRSAPTKIESAWELDHEPVTDWDASEGTPRRYVRARGGVGNVSGLVRIRTVNGDIVVRRGR